MGKFKVVCRIVGVSGNPGPTQVGMQPKLDKAYLWLESINSLTIKTKSTKLARLCVSRQGPWVKGSNGFRVREPCKSHLCHSLTCATLANQTPRSLGPSVLTVNEKQSNQLRLAVKFEKN